jgi:hypothetical protein
MVISKKLLTPILIALGLLVGLGLAFVYREYKDDISNFIGEEKETITAEEEYDTPYVANNTWDITFGVNESGLAPWGFYIFQPEVVEYKTVDGVNYLVGEYTFDDEAGGTREQVDIVISRDDEWLLNFDGLDKKAFEISVTSKIKYQESFNSSKVGYYGRSTLTFDQVKEMFPVGSRIALAIPHYYPAPDLRTEEICKADDETVCEYAKVWDILSVELEDFNS